MSATSSTGSSPEAVGRGPSSGGYRFGHESSGASGEWSVEWKLKRNCSLALHQLLGFCLAPCGVSLAVASFLWWCGATMVMPYACVEVLTVSFAVLAYARHAADGEWIALHRDRLMVEHAWGSRVQRVEFRRQWVRVGPQARNGSLVELSGQGEPSQWGATSVRN